MDKIIILSLGKSGTTSASLFFEQLKYKSLHWLGSVVDPSDFNNLSLNEILEKSKYLEEQYDVFSDYPYCMAYEYFDKKYNNTKFILITRDANDWAVSVKNHEKIFNFTSLRIASWQPYLDIKNKKMEDFSNEQLIKVYENHTKDVLKYFKNSKNFIHINLNDQDKAKKILNFLNIKSNIDFPKENISTTL